MAKRRQSIQMYLSIIIDFHINNTHIFFFLSDIKLLAMLRTNFATFGTVSGILKSLIITIECIHS